MLSKIHPLYFLLSFAFGLFICYIMKPKPTVVVKFPSPLNAGTITYRDTNDNCYKYKAEKTQCPLDQSQIKPQPIGE